MIADEKKKSLLIALSAGGDNSELAVDGIGMQHVDELMLQLATRLLSEGHRLAFGGTFNVAGQDLTTHLIDAAHRWSEEGNTRPVDINEPATWPIVNYAAWPYYYSIPMEQRARLVGICNFVEIDAESVPKEKKPDELSVGMSLKWGADSLSEMRRRMAMETDVRIVWGGKIMGAAGWMSGILEEVACSLEANKLVLILGGWGGAAKLIANYLSDPESEWPAKLSLGASANTERDKEMSASEWEAKNVQLQRVKSRLEMYRKVLHTEQVLHNCATEHLRTLLSEQNARRAMNLITELIT